MIHALLIGLSLIAVPSLPSVSDGDAQAILQGVGKLTQPDQPAILDVWGNDSYPVLTVRSDDDVHFASVAAGTYGKGRVAALGYPLSGDREVRRLCANAVRWASGAKSSPRVGYVGGPSGPAGAGALRGKDWPSGLRDLDVVFVSGNEIGDAKNVDALRRFVWSGGGLVVDVLAYQYMWDHPTVSPWADYQPNLLLEPMGIAYVDNNGYEADANGANEHAAAYAPKELGVLLGLAGIKGHGYPEKQWKQANGIVMDASRFAAPDSPFSRRLDKVVAGVGDVLVTPKDPLTSKDPLKRLAVVVRANEVRRLSADKIKADPSAEYFPGKVPPGAPRVKLDVTITVEVPQWASTGLYVPPGEVATVRLPKALVDKGLVAQIGCHNSPIVINDSWSRLPMIVMSWPLKKETTKIASPYGGLLYIVVPDGIRLPRQTVTIERAVRAPRYVRGETPLYQWQTQDRYYPAPFAEIGSSRLILTVPSSVARKIDDPEELMQVWDRIIDQYVDLGMRPLAPRPERIVADQQIAYGYMYAGYPIMTFLDAAEYGTDPKFLLGKGDWGHWHELGHNQQQPDWTFDGTVEVTVNLFTLHVMEHVPHHSVKEWLAEQMPNVRKYMQAGANFEKWKSDPFLALSMYAQLEQGFGWETYYKVFAEYRDLPQKDRPKTDAEKRDQWMVRFSRMVGKNLGPFFQAWGVPTSQAARDSIKDLPTWMPEGM
jgi:hypothetical protein